MFIFNSHRRNEKFLPVFYFVSCPFPCVNLIKLLYKQNRKEDGFATFWSCLASLKDKKISYNLEAGILPQIPQISQNPLNINKRAFFKGMPLLFSHAANIR
jgi:hypothetical protein